MAVGSVQITEAGVDSSQVKRECYIAYNFAAESKKKIPSKPVFIKAPRYGNLLISVADDTN